MGEIVHLALGVVQAILIAALVAAGRSFHARMLDPSEVRMLREWAGRLHEIGELSKAIERLNRTLHDEGFDRGQIARIKQFFFGTEARGSELHDLRGQLAEAKIARERLLMRVEGIETERRESNRRLDARLDRLEKQGADMLDTMTEMLRRWPTEGIRTTPPGGHSLSARREDEQEESEP